MAMTPTFYFEQIFPNYKTFKEFTDELELYEDSDTVSEAFNQYLFQIIYLRYKGNSVNYDLPENFEMEFGLHYVDVFRKYLFQKTQAEKIYELTDDELTMLTESLTNGSYNPNSPPTGDDYWAKLKFISNQSGSKLTNNKLISYINAIRNAPTLNVQGILKEFEDLFVWFMPTQIPTYRRF